MGLCHLAFDLLGLDDGPVKGFRNVLELDVVAALDFEVRCRLHS